MKSLDMSIWVRRLSLYLLSAVYFLTSGAIPASLYSSSSRLASGIWAKVKVEESGMQFISNSTLRNLGFSNPEKVNVYGFGGRMLPEKLDSSVPDDLPLIQSIHTAEGIVFFGHSSTLWSPSERGQLHYSHTANPYSDNSYYFISDIDIENPGPLISQGLTTGNDEAITQFTERLIHEKELIAPFSSGRLLLGEDFRTQSSRSFQFSLPDNLGDASLNIVFGAKISNGQSSIVVEANGIQLPATTADIIPGISSAETFLTMISSPKTAPDPGDKLNLTINYTYSGAIFTAALDYIQVEYPRAIRLYDNELYFYISPVESSAVKVDGCSESTLIWDVTDPLNPICMNHTLDRQVATFSSPAGYHEYVAFNPEGIRRAAKTVGKIENQDLHSMSSPDMVIITPPEYSKAARQIAEIHSATEGMDVAVIFPDQIYNEFSSGNPDVTAFRRLLKMWYDRSAGNETGYTRYCLLMSRPSYDNKMVTSIVKKDGYPRLPIWQSPTGLTSSTSYSTDDYIGMLADNNGIFNIANEKIHVAIGRMPVKSQSEADDAAAKLRKYLSSPTPGAWRNSILVIADDQDNAIHLEQAEKVIGMMTSHGNGASRLYERLYLDSYPLSFSSTGATYPLARQRMFDRFKDGVALINYIGHANSKEWGHEKLLTWNDIENLDNRKLPFIYASTCEFLNWDNDAISGGEKMWLKPDAGIIGMICPSRKVFISLNGTLNENISRYMFDRSPEGKPLRVGDIMTAGKNDTPNDDNKLRYALMGDPALLLPSPEYSITIDSIAGMDAGDPDNYPILKARSKVRICGKVTDFNGNPAENFNGDIDIQLFDAEKVVETYGNGESGKVSTYNDRNTRLAVAKAKVIDGEWNTYLMLPAEIENNFSPALLSFYASGEGIGEANGSFDGFYVYGFDENSSGDIDGPEFLSFYLNTPAFSDGDIVNPTPTLHAEFSDISGINISDAGIGHNMTLSIDDSKVLTDISSYFSPDPWTVGKGYINYNLPEMEPGEHFLTLTVWDNTGNSSAASLGFKVKADWRPSISGLTTDVNPAISSVNFIIDTDATDIRYCRIDVFDLTGRKVWNSDSGHTLTDSNSLSVGWDLIGTAGHRIQRGIYLYQATIITGNGTELSKTGKLAVTAG